MPAASRDQGHRVSATVPKTKGFQTVGPGDISSASKGCIRPCQPAGTRQEMCGKSALPVFFLASALSELPRWRRPERPSHRCSPYFRCCPYSRCCPCCPWHRLCRYRQLHPYCRSCRYHPLNRYCRYSRYCLCCPYYLWRRSVPEGRAANTQRITIAPLMRRRDESISW
jgi:hypothetical protein